MQSRLIQAVLLFTVCTFVYPSAGGSKDLGVERIERIEPLDLQNDADMQKLMERLKALDLYPTGEEPTPEILAHNHKFLTDHVRRLQADAKALVKKDVRQRPWQARENRALAAQKENLANKLKDWTKRLDTDLRVARKLTYNDLASTDEELIHGNTPRRNAMNFKMKRNLFANFNAKNCNTCGGEGDLEAFADPRVTQKLARRNELEKKKPEPPRESEDLGCENISPTRRVESPEALLRELGVDPNHKSDGKRMLSTYFNRPKLQGKSFACAGFAFASDLNFELNNRYAENFPPEVSPWTMYRHLTEKGDKGCLNASSAKDLKTDEGVQETLPLALSSMQANPVCDETGEMRIRIDQSVCLRQIGKLNGDHLRAMIDSDKPPVLTIGSDARATHEDWLKILPGGSVNHVVHVIGHGEGVNPQTLKKEKYFIVRDSFTNRKVDYKVSEENLLQNTVGLTKITKVSAHEVSKK